jgi:hypothetical protein
LDNLPSLQFALNTRFPLLRVRGSLACLDEDEPVVQVGISNSSQAGDGKCSHHRICAPRLDTTVLGVLSLRANLTVELRLGDFFASLRQR